MKCSGNVVKDHGPVAPERVKATPNEIESLRKCGFKLSRKERRAAAAHRRAEASRGEGDEVTFTSETRERQIILDTLWMARRYADGRLSYAPDMVNRAIDAALKLGIKIEADMSIGMYARHGVRAWDPETQLFVEPEGRK